MITNKDIRVENGSLIINGDPYPLDGQSPETIMGIVEDNSDTTPTENSTAPVTSGGVYTALGTKQDTLTFDDAPTENSTKPVKSGGVYTALAGKQDTLSFDDAPTENSTKPVKSGGVFTALAGKQDLIKVASGTLASSTGTVTLQYPTGVTKTDYCIIGWNITSGNNKYSGYSMGSSGSQLSISMSDSNISVYNNDSTFYGAQIDIIFAKI